MTVDVDSSQSIENIITLLTVQNNHIDFDRALMYYNGKHLDPYKKLSDYQIYDNDTVTLKESRRSTGCCIIFWRWGIRNRMRYYYLTIIIKINYSI